MSSKPKQCRKCGRLIVFRTRSDGRNKWVEVRDAMNDRHHNCPEIFIEAMMDFHKPVRCSCGDLIYEVPIFGGLIMQFDTVRWPWRTHECGRPNGVVPGIWNAPADELSKKCSELKLPESYLLVIIVCAKRMAGDEPKYTVALKSVFGRKYCTVFVWRGEVGKDMFRLGELSVLCGDDPQQKLLTNLNQIFDSDGPGEPGSLGLLYRWLEDAD
jgi:hypothetical protein